MGRGKKLKDLSGGNPFAKRFRFLMDNAEPKLSQEQLGKAIGVSKSAIAFYRDGRSLPDYSNLIKIAQYYNVTTDYLLGLTDATGYSPEIRIACDYTGLPEHSIRDIRRLLQDNLEDPLVLQKRRAGLSALLDSIYAPELLDSPREVFELVSNSAITLEMIEQECLKETDIAALNSLKKELDHLLSSIEFSFYRSCESWKAFLIEYTGFQEIKKDHARIKQEIEERISIGAAQEQVFENGINTTQDN